MLVVLLLVAPHPRRTQAARVALVAVFFLVTLATAVAVMALRWHYFTDTVAGAAVGTGTVLTLALLIDLASAVISNRSRLPANRGALPEQAGASGDRAAAAVPDE
jgi:membrane-associated phospholipid phosphatase